MKVFLRLSTYEAETGTTFETADDPQAVHDRALACVYRLFGGVPDVTAYHGINDGTGIVDIKLGINELTMISGITIWGKVLHAAQGPS